MDGRTDQPTDGQEISDVKNRKRRETKMWRKEGRKKGEAGEMDPCLFDDIQSIRIRLYESPALTKEMKLQLKKKFFISFDK